MKLPSMTKCRIDSDKHRSTSVWLPLLFGLTIFVGAALLFFVQPLVARLVLPKFGGAPSVWNTCMLFFQLALLAGYSYAHFSVARFGVRRQALGHLVLLLCPLAMLPIAAGAGHAPPRVAEPILPLLGMLAMMAGVPFFVVSTTAPLMQRWFAETGHGMARDPYFLYAASNVGSMLGLVAYPLLVEPFFTLAIQGRLWSGGYLLLLLLVTCCAWATVGRQGARRVFIDRKVTASTSGFPGTSSPRWRARGRWLLLAAIPSSLLLGVTAHLTSDVAPIPLLWVLPLAIYLLSYIVAFSRLPASFHRRMCQALPLGTLLLAFPLLRNNDMAPWWMLPHLVVFFVAAVACHGELAASRPSAERLTEFFLWTSAGGALGGAFNALVAPLIFTTFLEYPLALFLACCCIPRWSRHGTTSTRQGWEWTWPIVVGLLTAVLWKYNAGTGTTWAMAFPLLACAPVLGRPFAFAASLAAALLVGGHFADERTFVVHRERNFYGALKIWVSDDGKAMQLGHGRVLHGMQHHSENRLLRRIPLSYYYPTGPIGQVFRDFLDRGLTPRTAVVGLGVGTLAAYSRSGQELTFFELNPAVEKIARDTRYFTYLCDCKARLRVVLGDARLSLALEPERAFEIIVADAFSGDAVPVHLLTREAVEMYREKLAPRGVIAFHITNQYVELAPVLANVAAALGLAVIRNDEYSHPIFDNDVRQGKVASHWVLMAHSRDDFGALAGGPGWEELVGTAGSAWTDDFSNVFGAVRWTSPADRAAHD